MTSPVKNSDLCRSFPYEISHAPGRDGELILDFFVVPGEIVKKEDPRFKQMMEADLFESENPRYTKISIKNLIGTGAFGSVHCAQMHSEKTVRSVAVKVNKFGRGAFASHNQDALDQLLNEAEFLKLLSAHGSSDQNPFPQFIAARFISQERFCLLQTLCDGDLHQAIHTKMLADANIVQSVALQLLEGLSFLQSLHVVHCDLCPKNILTQYIAATNHFRVRIADFGLSIFENKPPANDGYIVTRYYRPIDPIVGLAVTCALDRWSLGCTLYEICTTKPLFPAGNLKDLFYMHHLFLGNASEDFVMRIPLHGNFFTLDEDSDKTYTLARRYRAKPLIPFNPRKEFQKFRASRLPWEGSSPKVKEGLFDIIEELIRWDPHDRKEPEQSLRHPIFTESSALDPEVVAMNCFSI